MTTFSDYITLPATALWFWASSAWTRLRHGHSEQARLLADHLREIALLGLAGAYVFSWTDDWHTGGHRVEDWAFGITDAERVSKASYAAVKRVFAAPLSHLLDERPRVSVVVCSYNGGATLDECLRSLCALNYPDYEIVVVDDGSNDDTREILARFPAVRVIHQLHLGLSIARNAGLECATGAVIAYTDSDCIADPDWLIHLVHQLMRSGAAAVGGPNLTPDDGWLAACVAAAPGQPTHVLLSDQVAEHIPGCNMAFRREALEAINGFDPQFQKAGDDVDICWRLQHEGLLITFAPGAFVWHHRRRNARSYLKQQAGYGEAEALLQSKHPDKFNGRGDGKWGGVMYGASLQGLQVASPIIYRGAFGTGMFQCLYQPGAAHWAMLPSTLEWHAAALLLGVAGALVRSFGWVVGAGMLALSILVAALQATQVQLGGAHRYGCGRLLVAGLCYAQPLVRSWTRYRTRLSSAARPCPDSAVLHGPRHRLSWRGLQSVAYWSETGSDRTEILRRAVAFMEVHRWGKMLDTGWLDWDISVYCDSGLVLKVVTVQEEHGQGKRHDPDSLPVGPVGQATGRRRGQPRRIGGCRALLSSGGDGRGGTRGGSRRSGLGPRAIRGGPSRHDVRHPCAEDEPDSLFSKRLSRNYRRRFTAKSACPHQLAGFTSSPPPKSEPAKVASASVPRIRVRGDARGTIIVGDRGAICLNFLPRKKIVLLGMMARMPVAGVVWQTVQYLVGFQRLGYDAYYVEAHATSPTMFLDSDDHDGSDKVAAFLDRVLRRFDFGDRWAFHALHADGRSYGLSAGQLAQPLRLDPMDHQPPWRDPAAARALRDEPADFPGNGPGRGPDPAFGGRPADHRVP